MAVGVTVKLTCHFSDFGNPAIKYVYDWFDKYVEEAFMVGTGPDIYIPGNEVRQRQVTCQGHSQTSWPNIASYATIKWEGNN